jgi:hypothetical protein
MRKIPVFLFPIRSRLFSTASSWQDGNSNAKPRLILRKSVETLHHASLAGSKSRGPVLSATDLPGSRNWLSGEVNPALLGIMQQIENQCLPYNRAMRRHGEHQKCQGSLLITSSIQQV